MSETRDNVLQANEPLNVMQFIKYTNNDVDPNDLRDAKTGIYDFGTNYTTEYTFPMPEIEGYAGSYTDNIDGGNNANGDFIGVVISSKVNISGFSWAGLDAEKGRELLSLFTGGDNYVFFARYYDVVRGEFVQCLGICCAAMSYR